MYLYEKRKIVQFCSSTTLASYLLFLICYSYFIANNVFQNDNDDLCQCTRPMKYCLIRRGRYMSPYLPIFMVYFVFCRPHVPCNILYTYIYYFILYLILNLHVGARHFYFLSTWLYCNDFFLRKHFINTAI